MSMSVLRPYGLDSAVGEDAGMTTELGGTSPFAPVGVGFRNADTESAPAPGQVLSSPFAEAAVAAGDDERGAEATDALLAELDDEEFAEALEELVDEAAARHLRSVGTWSSDSEAPSLATTETTEWLEELAREADRVLGTLEAHFGERRADTLQNGEIEAISGVRSGNGFVDPASAQQMFLGGLLDKAKKLARGVGKLAQKGLAVVGNLALGPLFGVLRKLVRPLLRKVLDSAIGRLPASVRPIATQLAAKLHGSGETGPGTELAEEFDQELTEAALSGRETEEQPGLGRYEELGAGHDLDEARARLNRELAGADPNVPPIEQMEQFIPVVMAALPLIRTGIKIIGRDRIVNGIAKPLSTLIQGMIGADAAKLLSRHIASAGLGLLGLEASEYDSTLGSEALVAAAEDTVRGVLAMPPESLENGLLLETAVQDAFAEAVARHLPAAVLRPDLVERELDGENGVWVMMPRATRPCFRYKKYSRVVPVHLTRPMARAVVLSGGETLERRLLDDGNETWPVEGEVELYELLPGGGPGHMAAYESEDGTDAHEFDVLTESAAATLLGNRRFAHTGQHHRHHHHHGSQRQAGSRYFRFRHHGRSLHRRHFFALGFDLTAPQPVLRVNLLIGERDSHDLVAQLQRRQLVQVVSRIRGLLDEAALHALGKRLDHLLGKHKITAPEGGGRALAGKLAEAMLRSLAQQLPGAAAALTQAAKDSAPGVTLTFAFAFASRDAVTAGTPASDPTVTIRPGVHRD